ncbi:MAG: FAD:protein FMN transferase [Terriglobia bacterium]
MSRSLRPPDKGSRGVLRPWAFLGSLLIWIALAHLGLGVCPEFSPPGQRFEFTQPLMGTTARIVLYAAGPSIAMVSSRAAFERMTYLEGLLSDYQPESELNQLCENAIASPRKVSTDLFAVLAESQVLAIKSEGAFDITVGPVVQLWRRARRRHELPSDSRLSEALKLVGYQKLTLNPEMGTAQLQAPGMQLDLGGIAKGYAADEGLKTLQSHGVNTALVAIGGDIALGNPPPHKPGWEIDINPGPAFQRKSSHPLFLSHRGVSTSGDAEQFIEIAGNRYSHIVDPRTGLALSGYRSVTVVAPNAMASDALATTLCVLGPRSGLHLLQSEPCTSAIYLESVHGRVQTFTSKRWNTRGECKGPATAGKPAKSK